MAQNVREPAVAGLFYDENPKKLRSAIEQFLKSAGIQNFSPKALIVPHAGYMYSGPVAASAFALLKNVTASIERVVLLGPAHRVPLRGLALSTAQIFRTPLGDVALDHSLDADLQKLPQIKISDESHEFEHSLEVQLPFLQILLKDFKLIPIVVGDTKIKEVADVLEKLWGGDETLILISSDLSHYYNYDHAQKLDEKTAHAIENFCPQNLKGEDACGCHPIQGLLQIVQNKKLKVKRLDLRNSGDTAGSKDQVVGYGAWVFY